MHNDSPEYGLDAPGVVRNLLIAGIACLTLWGTAVAGWWSGVFAFEPFEGVRIIFPVRTAAWLPGLSCLSMGLWMIWSSKVGKLQSRERLLRHIEWRGDERVLDVGCGRGLLLVGAAKHLTSGAATGIDSWQAKDLSGNRQEATLANAQIEGVEKRVDVQTADMRSLPFPDATFDIVLSRAAIHNLSSAGDRAKAIREIARVLKPGGQALISDIRHTHEYVRTIEEYKGEIVRRIDSPVAAILLTFITMGSLRPATVLIRKTA